MFMRRIVHLNILAARYLEEFFWRWNIFCTYRELKTQCKPIYSSVDFWNSKIVCLFYLRLYVCPSIDGWISSQFFLFHKSELYLPHFQIYCTGMCSVMVTKRDHQTNHLCVHPYPLIGWDPYPDGVKGSGVRTPCPFQTPDKDVMTKHQEEHLREDTKKLGYHKCPVNGCDFRYRSRFHMWVQINIYLNFNSFSVYTI
jgi:hypothetical protein